jgi:capsule polysaccharide export protein KpsE/RkpR
MDPVFQREQLAYAEKIALAKLEVSKAEERVKELEYQLSRFSLEYFMAAMKQQQQQNPPKQE